MVKICFCMRSEEAQSGDESLGVSSADDDDISAELAPAWQNGAAAPGEAPWPAHRALREWRQSGRECHLYAYAPYTRFGSWLLWITP